MAAASASASTSEDHELLRFLPYNSSQLYLEQAGTAPGSSLAPPNGSAGSNSSLRDSHGHSSVSRSRSDTAASVIYGSIPDVISLDWAHRHSNPKTGKTDSQHCSWETRETWCTSGGLRPKEKRSGKKEDKYLCKKKKRRRKRKRCTEKKYLFSLLLLYINNRTLPAQWVTSVHIFCVNSEGVFSLLHVLSLDLNLFCIFYTLFAILFHLKHFQSQSFWSFWGVSMLFNDTLLCR